MQIIEIIQTTRTSRGVATSLASHVYATCKYWQSHAVVCLSWSCSPALHFAWLQELPSCHLGDFHFKRRASELVGKARKASQAERGRRSKQAELGQYHHPRCSGSHGEPVAVDGHDPEPVINSATTTTRSSGDNNGKKPRARNSKRACSANAAVPASAIAYQ